MLKSRWQYVLYDYAGLRPYVAFSAALIFAAEVQPCLSSSVTQYLMCFSDTNLEISSTQNYYVEEFNNHSGLGSEKWEAFKSALVSGNTLSLSVSACVSACIKNAAQIAFMINRHDASHCHHLIFYSFSHLCQPNLIMIAYDIRTQVYIHMETPAGHCDVNATLESTPFYHSLNRRLIW